MNMNVEKILRYATILSDSSSVPQKFPFADVPAERILEASSSKLQPFLETVFQILASSHCIVVTENRPVAEFLLAMNQTQSEADHKVGVFCGGKLEAEAISESMRWRRIPLSPQTAPPICWTSSCANTCTQRRTDAFCAWIPPAAP